MPKRKGYYMIEVMEVVDGKNRWSPMNEGDAHTTLKEARLTAESECRGENVTYRIVHIARMWRVASVERVVFEDLLT